LTQQSAQAYWSISSKVPVKKKEWKNGKMEKWKKEEKKESKKRKRERENPNNNNDPYPIP